MNTELKKLQKEWYQKLKDDGFEDIEYFDQQGTPQDWLKRSGRFVSLEPGVEPPQSESVKITSKATRDYYLNATQLLLKVKFKNKTEKLIWESHAEGVTLRAIAKLAGCSHSRVLRIITKIKENHMKKKETNQYK